MGRGHSGSIALVLIIGVAAAVACQDRRLTHDGGRDAGADGPTDGGDGDTDGRGQDASRCEALDAAGCQACTDGCPDPCAGLREDRCLATDGCETATCPVCERPGVERFAACYQPGLGGPPPCASCEGTCRGLDRASCEAAADQGCQVTECPDCAGTLQYSGCDRDRLPCVPPGECADCAVLDEAACRQTVGCRLDLCFDCAGQGTVTCARSGEPMTACAGCPADPCVGLDETACGASTACHRVFADMDTCDCAEPGCCLQFARCALGQRPDCEIGASCADPAPPCGIVGEVSPYVLSYVDGCYEGCVLGTDCR